MIDEGIIKLVIRSFVGSMEKEKENVLKLLLEFLSNEVYCVKIVCEKGVFVFFLSLVEDLEYFVLFNLVEDVFKCLEVVDENVEYLVVVGRFEFLLSRFCEG